MLTHPLYEHIRQLYLNNKDSRIGRQGGTILKFIHTGDIHWGITPDSDKPWSKERTYDIKETFAAIIECAKKRNVDCLFIAGDLFHHQPLQKDLKEVNDLFSMIPHIRVVIVAGNHDPIRKNSAYLSFSWSPNVLLFESEQLCSVYFRNINTEVTGFSYHTTEITDARLNQAKCKNDERIHILLGHGGDLKHVPINLNKLADSNFSYIALGHIHKPEILLEKRAAFCGSPEPLNSTETGEHGIFIGEINPSSKKLTSLEFLPIAKCKYISLRVNVTPTTTNTELFLKISQEIEKRGASHIFRFRICGMRDPDLTFDLTTLSLHYKVVDILDESEPQYDFNTLLAKHSGDMIGFYINTLKKKNMNAEEKKALYHGIHALLLTNDERN